MKSILYAVKVGLPQLLSVEYVPMNPDKLQSVTAGYLLPEVMPYLYCLGCLVIALKKSGKAKRIYDRIVESYKLPRLKSMFDMLQDMIPSGESMKNILKEESAPKVAQAKRELKLWFPDKDSFANVFEKILGSMPEAEPPLSEKETMKVVEDLTYWLNQVGDLIQVGFNRESEQARGIYKVTISSSQTLMLVILAMSFAESRGFELTEEDGEYTVKLDGKYYDITNTIAPENTDRGHRLITQGLKEYGYALKHSDKIAQVAERWYQSRVVYSGIGEYCNQSAFKGIRVSYANVSKEIKDCDKAMGYPRGKPVE